MPSRPVPGQIEERTEPVVIEGRRIRGRIPFGSESRDLGGFTEIIEPGALNEANLDELVARVEHTGVPIGRYPSTLALEHRSDGLHWSVEPPASRQDVIEAVQRGDLRGGSWRMRVARDHWIGDVRHIDSISDLQDVSVVTRPAYLASEVELRSTPQEPNMSTTAPNEIADQDEDATEASTLTGTVTPDGSAGPPEARSAPENRSQGTLRVEGQGRTGNRRGLTDRFRDAGFPGESASLPFADCFEERAVTWTQNIALMNQLDRVGVPLPQDERYLWPALARVDVGQDVTSVLVATQTARALASAASMIRAIDATTAKPTTGSTLDLLTVPLKQVATVQSGVPNIYLLQPAINSIIEVDLRLAINEALDKLALDAIAASGFQAPGTDQLLVSIRKAVTTLQGLGYNPDTLVLTPAAAEALDTLVSGLTGGVNDYIFPAGGFAPNDLFGLSRRISKSAPAPIVFDSAAIGKLYASPVSLARFEEAYGGSNSSLIRLELNAAVGVERVTAAVRIAAA